MKPRYPLLFAFVLAFTASVFAQDSGSAPPPSQGSGQSGAQGSNGGHGRRGGGGYGGGMGMMGRGTMGTVTEAAADHYTIKTDTGDVYTVHFDANTRIVKQPAGAGMRGQGGGGQSGGGQGPGGGEGMGGGMGRGNPPQQIKAADIKVGDMIRAMGDVDATAKTVAARTVMQLDPATVQQIKEMEANFGKTWLAGKVTAIDGTKITLTGAMDNAPHTLVADENTTFRKRRDPVTLADIQVGDTIRVEGAVKDGVFTASTVNVGGMMGGGEGPGGPRNPPPQ
jgi:Domain of unknown function (DUF5666)